MKNKIKEHIKQFEEMEYTIYTICNGTNSHYSYNSRVSHMIDRIAMVKGGMMDLLQKDVIHYLENIKRIK